MNKLLTACLAICLAGCATFATFEKNANAAMGAMDIAVTIASTIWQRYVDAGGATTDQISRAKKSLIRYEQAKKVFADAMLVYDKDQSLSKTPVEEALDALNYASIDIVDLIMSFVPVAERTELAKAQRKMLDQVPRKVVNQYHPQPASRAPN